MPAKVRPSVNTLVRNDLAKAFVISILLHFLVIATVETGRGLNLWRFSVLPKWMQSRLYEEVKKEEQRRLEKAAQQKQPEEQEMPLLFVEVDPSQAVQEEPKQAKYYSSQNTLASNPQTPREKDVPKVEGRQEKVPKVFDVMRPDLKSVQPAPTPPQKKPEPEPQPQPAEVAPQPVVTPKPEEKPQPEPPPEPKPEPKPLDPGDLQLAHVAPQTARPQPSLAPQQPAPKPQRPRTLAEAVAQKGLIQGEKIKQEGGVRRFSLESNMDVKATPFGSYDAAFIAAVQARWFNLLDERDFVQNRAGKVVIEFRLNKDGRITDLRVDENEVTEMLGWLCERAILDPAPYAPFPPDLKRLLRNDYRDVRFTFYYNQ